MAVTGASARGWDRAIDCLIALVVLGAILVDSETGEHGTGISVIGIVTAVGASAPLLWRRSSPVTVMVLIIPFVLLANFTLESYDAAMAAPAVALYSVARYGERRRSLLVAAAVTPIIIVGVALTGEEVISGITLENLAWALLAIAAGDAVRSRLAATADMAQRRQAELREAEAEADRRVAQERLQIAREVHDVVAHSMVAINVQAGTAAHLLETQPEQAEKALREIKRVSGTALNDLRATLGILREEGTAAPTRPAGRLQQLSGLAEPLRASGVDVEIEVDGPASDVPPAVGAAAYRIVQEALTNVVRHADASRAEVRVGVGADVLNVEVLDDGEAALDDVPFDLDAARNGTGNGIRGMGERAAAIGGTVESGRLPGGGWRVHAALPLRTS